MGKNLIKRAVSCAMVCFMVMGMVNVEDDYNTTINTISASATSDYTSFKQGDSRWKNMHLGTSSYTMSNSGCAVTALSSLMVHCGSVTSDSFNPGVLCEFFNNNGGFSSNGDLSWSTATKYASSFTFEGYETLSSSSVSGKTEEIEEYLNEGYYLIVGVKDGGHWVAIDRVENGTVYMFDPAKGVNTSLFDTYNNSGIYKVRVFRGANSPKLSDDAIEQKEVERAEEVEELPNVEDNEVSKEIKNSSNSKYTTGLYMLTYELCLRTDAYSQADVIDILPVVTNINVSEVDGEWGYVCYNGNMGWINLGYTKQLQSSYSYSTGTYTTAEPLNFRASNSTDAESYGLIDANTQVQVTSIKDNWGKINYQGKDAWICLDYCSVGDNTYSTAVNIAVSNNSDYQIGSYKTTDNVYLRSGNSTSEDKLDLIESGTSIDIIEIKDDWGKTVYNGTVGWVCLDYTKFQNSFKNIPCDVNGDGKVSVTDVHYVSNKINNGEDFSSKEIYILDFDNDGIVSYSDYAILKDVILN